MAVKKARRRKNVSKRRGAKRISAALKTYLASLKRTNPAFRRAGAVRVKVQARTGTVTLTPMKHLNPGNGYVIYPSGRTAFKLSDARRIAKEESRDSYWDFSARVESVDTGKTVVRYRHGKRA